LEHQKAAYHSSLSHSHSLSGNTGGGETEKRWGHGQNYAGKTQFSAVILF